MASCGRYILVKDVDGFKADGAVKSAIKKLVGGDQYSMIRVLRGELVELYAINVLNFNMSLCRDPAVLMYLNDDHLAPLSREEFSLLDAIQLPADRFVTFIIGGLDLGARLVLGSKVYVETNGTGHVKTQVIATVQFKGEVQGCQGTHFGVELMVSESSSICSNGTLHGRRYFNCEDGFGLFVPLNRLTAYHNGKFSQNAAGSCQQGPRGVSAISRVSAGGTEDTPISNTRLKSKVKGSSVDVPSFFQIGDRVHFFNKKGGEHTGTVKWAGISTPTRKFEYNMIGIHTDEIVCHTDFEKSVLGMSHHVGAPKYQCLFIPESMLDKIEKGKHQFEESITTHLVGQEKMSKDEILKEQNRILAGTKRMFEDKQLAEAVEESEENVEEQLQHFQKMETDNGKHQPRKYECQGSERLKPEHQGIEHECASSISDQDKTIVYSQNDHMKSQSASGSQANGECSVFTSSGDGPAFNFNLNSMVLIPCADKDVPFRYGVIRWIGFISKMAEKVAGIELARDF